MMGAELRQISRSVNEDATAFSSSFFFTPGVVPIHSGEIAEDLAYYLADSEQTQSALGLGVSLDRSGQVRHAGGFLLTVLPFADEETLAALERNLSSVPSVTDMMGQGLSPKQIADRLLEGLPEGSGVSGGHVDVIVRPTWGRRGARLAAGSSSGCAPPAG